MYKNDEERKAARQASQRRWHESEGGQRCRDRYEASPQGKATKAAGNKRYREKKKAEWQAFVAREKQRIQDQAQYPRNILDENGKIIAIQRDIDTFDIIE